MEKLVISRRQARRLIGAGHPPASVERVWGIAAIVSPEGVVITAYRDDRRPSLTPQRRSRYDH